MEELEKTALSNKEDVLPAMIVEISGFLNRFLYEGEDELIPLQLEIKIIEEFLDIHKLLAAGLKVIFLSAGMLNRTWCRRFCCCHF